jgi:hypothetical protein
MNLPGSTATFASFKSVSIDPTDIVFQATGSAGQEGIFADIRGGLIDLVNVSDVIGGKTILQLDLGPIAFSLVAGFPTVTYRATFVDSSSSIFTATLPPLLGDINRDAHVDMADVPAMLVALTDLNSYKSNNALTDVALLSIADIDFSGVINNADVQALLTLLKSGGGSNGAVPEPASAALIALALPCFAFAVVRRRGT